MKFYITDKNIVKEITLREWDNNTDSWCYGGADIFGELEVSAPNEHPIGDYDTDADAAVTEDEYNEIVEWWTDECHKYNNREASWFTEYCNDDEEFAKNHEMIINAD